MKESTKQMLQAIRIMGRALNQMTVILDRMEKSIDAIETRNWKSIPRQLRKRASFSSNTRADLEKAHAVCHKTVTK